MSEQSGGGLQGQGAAETLVPAFYTLTMAQRALHDRTGQLPYPDQQAAQAPQDPAAEQRLLRQTTLYRLQDTHGSSAGLPPAERQGSDRPAQQHQDWQVGKGWAPTNGGTASGFFTPHKRQPVMPVAPIGQAAPAARPSGEPIFEEVAAKYGLLPQDASLLPSLEQTPTAKPAHEEAPIEVPQPHPEPSPAAGVDLTDRLRQLAGLPVRSRVSAGRLPRFGDDPTITQKAAQHPAPQPREATIHAPAELIALGAPVTARESEADKTAHRAGTPEPTSTAKGGPESTVHAPVLAQDRTPAHGTVLTGRPAPLRVVPAPAAAKELTLGAVDPGAAILLRPPAPLPVVQDRQPSEPLTGLDNPFSRQSPDAPPADEEALADYSAANLIRVTAGIPDLSGSRLTTEELLTNAATPVTGSVTDAQKVVTYKPAVEVSPHIIEPFSGANHIAPPEMSMTATIEVRQVAEQRLQVTPRVENVETANNHQSGRHRRPRTGLRIKSGSLKSVLVELGTRFTMRRDNQPREQEIAQAAQQISTLTEASQPMTAHGGITAEQQLIIDPALASTVPTYSSAKNAYGRYHTRELSLTQVVEGIVARGEARGLIATQLARQLIEQGAARVPEITSGWTVPKSLSVPSEVVNADKLTKAADLAGVDAQKGEHKQIYDRMPQISEVSGFVATRAALQLQRDQATRTDRSVQDRSETVNNASKPGLQQPETIIIGPAEQGKQPGQGTLVRRVARLAMLGGSKLTEMAIRQRRVASGVAIASGVLGVATIVTQSIHEQHNS